LNERFSPERFSRVINCQVITESGQQLGRVLGFSFDIETGELTTLVMGALGVPLLGEGVLSTWEISVDEIVSSGADRIIVYEGAEEKLKQLNSGFLEKLGVGSSSWEDQERDRYRVNLVPVENQLASGEINESVQKSLKASNNQILEQEEELEYVELDAIEQEKSSQRRYLDDPNEGSLAEFNSYEEERSFQQDPLYETERKSPEEKTLLDEAKPARPASRRPAQSLDEPLDVEPLDTFNENNISQPIPPSTGNELEDPW